MCPLSSKIFSFKVEKRKAKSPREIAYTYQQKLTFWMELLVWSKFSKLVKFNALRVDVGAPFLVYFTQSTVNTVRRSESVLTRAVVCLCILSVCLSALVCSALWLGWFLLHSPPPTHTQYQHAGQQGVPGGHPEMSGELFLKQTTDSVYFNQTHVHHNLRVCCFLYRASWNNVKEKKFFWVSLYITKQGLPSKHLHSR